METFLQDLRHSLRMFRANPGFVLTAVAALALGIGTNTAIFSVVNTVLLRPVPAPEPDRVVVFLATNSFGAGTIASEIKFNLWRAQTSVFQDVSGYRPATANLTGADPPVQVRALQVTADYFRLFGLPIAQGRGFTAEEERPNGRHVAVLANAFWKRALGGDTRIVGKIISLNGDPFEVVGIMAEGIQTEPPEPPDVWMPFAIDPNSTYQVHYFQAAGRLKPGITLAMANAQLQLTTQEFYRKFPDSLAASRADIFSVEPMRDVVVKNVRSSLLTLAGAVSLVLLIACANVANLLLARAAGRRREIAVRVAVGASRGRIMRQLLTESVLLAAAGAALGMGLGIAGIHSLLALNPSNLPRIGVNGSNVNMDWRVLLFTVLLVLITGLLFGLMPALDASRTDLNSHLKESSGRSGTGLRSNHARAVLVVSEMSLALVLLIGSALLIRTLIALRSVKPGFDPHNVVIARTTLDPRFAKTAGVDALVQDVLRRLSAVPGVESAGLTGYVPLDANYNSLPIVVAGRPLNGPSHGNSRWEPVSPGYFDALRIPLIRGRGFTDADRLGAPGVAIINQTMARYFWPGEDPLGRQLFIGRGLGPMFEEPARQIVGIVGDVHDVGLGRDPLPAVFVPDAQRPDARRVGSSVAWVVRTRGPSASTNSALEKELRQATGLAVPAVRSMEEVVVQSTSPQDFNMLLMSIFGGSALLLAVIGIYGLMAYSVQQRTQEMGIRMALGARAGDVRRMVVWQGMRLALAGAAIGIAAAFGLTRLLASFLFGVNAMDPLVFVLAPLALSSVALLAVWLPAQRASRVDPIQALRHE